MRLNNLFKGLLAAIGGMTLAGAAFAQDSLSGLESIGKPTLGAMGFQPAATELARDQQWLDGMVLIIITVITIFVTLLILWIVFRYNSRINKTPATFTHHSLIEVVWTILPILILIVIGSFSLPLLFKELETPESDLTIKVTGNQWYWTYSYPENEFEFDSYMIGSPATMDEASDPNDANVTPFVNDEFMAIKLENAGYAADEFLLAADTAIVVPVGAVVRVHVTGSDVNHSFAVPAFGIKIDAIVGRLNETWFRVGADPEDIADGTDSNENYIGIYFGQCSELCGKDHSYMPIVVKVVSEEDYAIWLAGAIEEYGGVAAVAMAQAN
ncbi:MAG: cytochrome c oxidase subunit II [Rhodobacteraceae bacterium]|nr:cytochrome c oxidase subunit II [Paracoccaceae bacterium]